MFMFARCSALVLVALALSGWAAQAQVAPVPYANSNWFLGLGNSGLDGGDEAARNGMPTGWFMTGTRNNFNTSGFNRLGAFGGYNGLSSEGVQFGYKFQNASSGPLTLFGGLDTLKYNGGVGGGPFSSFDNQNNQSGYRMHGGVEFQPAPNVSLSLGMSYTQQPVNPANDIRSLTTSPFAGR